MSLEEELARITDRQELVDVIINAPPNASLILVQALDIAPDEALEIEGWLLGQVDVHWTTFVLASFISQINCIDWDAEDDAVE
jgi:electron transfer flavoprotein alpha/beta subunit